MTEPHGRPDAAAVRVFPPGIPLLAVIIAAALNRVWPIEIAGVASWPGRTWIGAAIVAVSVVGFGAWSIVLFRRSGQDPNPRTPSPELVEQGPYRITRNPMYVQFIGICLGLALWMPNMWLLLLTPVVAVVLDRLVIHHEEEYLEHKFGARYQAYKRRVRRWL